ncbi:MAG: hypothetical protein QOH30_3819 [Baekduia sp.]|nr:hypothetical protein [Baekduia sp.]
MRLRWVLLTTLLCLTAAPAGASAAADPPVLGPADGVQATLTDGRTVEIRFTGTGPETTALLGRRVIVECAPRPDLSGLQFVDHGDEDQSVSTGGAVTAGGVLRVQLPKAKPVDACNVLAGPDDRAVFSDTVVARAPLDAAGAVWVDEATRAHALRDLLIRARTTEAYRPAAAMVGGGVVAVNGPAATPPAGQVGYWTDGAAHAVAATFSAGGRRLAIEDLGDGMVRTNVLDQGAVLFPALEVAFGGPFTVSSGSSASEREPDADGRGGSSPYRANRVGSGDGVRARFSGRRLTMRFTGRSAAALRTVAGRRVLITCVVRPDRGLFGGALQPPVEHDAVVRAPRRGATLTATLPGTGDVCAIADDGKPVAIAPATVAGRRWFADVEADKLLASLPGSLAAQGGTAYLPAGAIVAKGKGDRLVTMSGPGGAVKPGHVGVWTDGARHAAVAVTSTSGRRIVLADEGDGTVRTNAFAEVLGTMLFAAG